MRKVCLLVLTVLLFSACSGSSGSTGTTTEPEVPALSSDAVLQSWVENDPFRQLDAQQVADQLKFGGITEPSIPSELLTEVSLSDEDVRFLNLALQAYLWGYAPMTVYRLEKAKTNSQAPLNHFFHATHLPDWQLPSPVSAPDVDVLYSSAFLDLDRSAMKFNVPQVQGYYVVQIDDAYGNSQASIGLRTQPGGQAKNYLIVGPNDPGYLDPTAHEKDGYTRDQIIPVDTPHAWVIVRVPVDAYSVPGSPDTLEQSQAYNDTLNFTLDALNGDNRRDPMIGALATEFETPPDNALVFFRWLGEAVSTNPPPTQIAFELPVHPPYLMSPSASVGQTAIFQSFAPLGLDAGGFHPAQLTERQLILLQAALELGNKVLAGGQAYALNGPESQNFWHVTATSNIGKYPNDWSGWFVRSVAAFEGGIASLAVDGTYPLTGSDIRGHALDGRHNYRIHFEQDELPPIQQGFWSLTIYTNNTANGSQANLPYLAAAAANNTAYSQVPNRPVKVQDTSHFFNPSYADNDTIFFAQAAGGLAAETPYYVLNADRGSFQLSATWNVDPTQMVPLQVDPGIVAQTLLSGEVIPVYSLGSQQLDGQTLRGNTLELNRDGSLTLYLQNQAPERRNNWLPIPASGQFQVMMRLYDPSPATAQTGQTSILSDTTIPLTTPDAALAAFWARVPLTRDNAHGTYVVPGIRR